jgi:phage-related protein
MIEELKVIISAEVGKLKSAVDEAQGKIDELASSDSKLSKLNEGFTKVGDVAKKGLAVAGAAVAGVGVALMSTVGATEEYRAAQAKLVSAFETAGSSASVAKDTYNDLYRVLGDGDVAVEAANHLAKLTTEEKALNEWTTICQGVYATFGDSLPIEGLTEAANETAKVGTLTGSLADALNWAGVNEEDFQAKLDACATEQEREALIRETLNGLYTDAAAAYEENAAAILAQNEAQAKSEENMARIGAAMAPVQTMLTELGATLAEKVAPLIEDFIAEHGPEIEKTLDKVADGVGKALEFIIDNWDTISTIGTIVLAIAAALAVLSTGLSVYSTVMGVASAVSLPVVGIVAAIVAGIAALIAIIVVCVKNWDTITEAIGNFAKKVGEFFTGLWDSITEWISGIGESISGWWEDTKQGFSDWWGGIKEGWSDFWSGVGSKIKEGVDNAKTKFNEMKTNIAEKVEETKSKVKEKYEQMKTAMGNVLDAAKTTVQGKLDNMKAAYEKHGGGIKGVASAAIEGIKGYYSAGFTFIDNLTGGKLSNIANSFKNKMNEAKTAVSTVLENIKTKFSNIMENAKSIVSGAIEKIKGFFNFKWELPKIKLPHFSISGKFSLDPPSIPKISVDWYKLGGVFDNPTLFGYGNGMIGGLGEDGAEAIVPLEKNTEWMNVLAAKLSERLSGGNTPVVLQVDGKTFAKTAINTMNDYSRQTGSLGLQIV